MVQQPITYAGFVNIARLWIIDLECVVWTVPIGFIDKFAMKRKDITGEI